MTDQGGMLLRIEGLVNIEVSPWIAARQYKTAAFTWRHIFRQSYTDFPGSSSTLFWIGQGHIKSTHASFFQL